MTGALRVSARDIYINNFFDDAVENCPFRGAGKSERADTTRESGAPSKSENNPISRLRHRDYISASWTVS